MLQLDPNDNFLEYRNEENLLVDVFYIGQRFTGSLRNEREYIEYRDGVVHGLNISYYPGGEIECIDKYDNGDFIEGRTYFEQGQLKIESIANSKSYKVWNLKAQLVQDGNITYFNNGEIRSIVSSAANTDFALKCFSRQGEVVYTQLKDERINGKLVRNFTYDDDLLLKNYSDLLVCENPELVEENLRSGDHNIWMWFWKIFEKDPGQYIKIMNTLLTHPQIEVKKCMANIIAVHKFNNFVEPENNENAEGIAFIKEYSEFHNNREPGRTCRVLKLQP